MTTDKTATGQAYYAAPEHRIYFGQGSYWAEEEHRVYYNTVSEAGPQLAEYQAKAGEQNETVLAIFHVQNRQLSPSQVLELWPHWLMRTPPLTSIRRAITTLTKAGALVKTETKRKGVYGRMEHVWTLPEATP